MEEKDFSEAVAKSRQEYLEESDPRSESEDGETMFIDKEMFPEGCEEGDRVEFCGRIVSMGGEKYGIQPESVSKKDDDGEETDDY